MFASKLARLIGHSVVVGVVITVNFCCNSGEHRRPQPQRGLSAGSDRAKADVLQLQVRVHFDPVEKYDPRRHLQAQRAYHVSFMILNARPCSLH